MFCWIHLYILYYKWIRKTERGKIKKIKGLNTKNNRRVTSHLQYLKVKFLKIN
jgi:hypothetical protein